MYVASGVCVLFPHVCTTVPNKALCLLLQVVVTFIAIVVPINLVLILIVQPKINRVLSGKKVVVSNLLRKQLDSEGSETTSVTGGTATGISGFLHSPRTESLPSVVLPKIRLHANEPLPRKLELSMYQMMSVLRNLTRRLSDGRSLRQSDWNAFSSEAFKLAEWTKRIEFEHDMDEEASERGETEMVGNGAVDVGDPLATPAASSPQEEQTTDCDEALLADLP